MAHTVIVCTYVMCTHNTHTVTIKSFVQYRYTQSWLAQKRSVLHNRSSEELQITYTNAWFVYKRTITIIDKRVHNRQKGSGHLDT